MKFCAPLGSQASCADKSPMATGDPVEGKVGSMLQDGEPDISDARGGNGNGYGTGGSIQDTRIGSKSITAKDGMSSVETGTATEMATGAATTAATGGASFSENVTKVLKFLESCRNGIPGEVAGETVRFPLQPSEFDKLYTYLYPDAQLGDLEGVDGPAADLGHASADVTCGHEVTGARHTDYELGAAVDRNKIQLEYSPSFHTLNVTMAPDSAMHRAIKLEIPELVHWAAFMAARNMGLVPAAELLRDLETDIEAYLSYPSTDETGKPRECEVWYDGVIQHVDPDVLALPVTVFEVHITNCRDPAVTEELLMHYKGLIRCAVHLSIEKRDLKQRLRLLNYPPVPQEVRISVCRYKTSADGQPFVEWDVEEDILRAKQDLSRRSRKIDPATNTSGILFHLSDFHSSLPDHISFTIASSAFLGIVDRAARVQAHSDKYTYNRRQMTISPPASNRSFSTMARLSPRPTQASSISTMPRPAGPLCMGPRITAPTAGMNLMARAWGLQRQLRKFRL